MCFSTTGFETAHHLAQWHTEICHWAQRHRVHPTNTSSGGQPDPELNTDVRERDADSGWTTST